MMMSSCTFQWWQEEGTDTPVTGWRQHAGTAESSPGLAIANSCFPLIPLADKL